MKHNEWRYSIKAGFKSLGRHPLLSMAAITTLVLMLFLTSAFVAFSLNANHLSKIASQQPPIEISMSLSAEQADLDLIENYLIDSELVQMYEMRTPLENYEQFKNELGKEELWKGFDYETYIPHTINVRLNDPATGDEFKREVENLPAVHEVMMESHLMAFLGPTTARTIGTRCRIFFLGSPIISMANATFSPTVNESIRRKS
jgi:cell division transport system permease protein